MAGTATSAHQAAKAIKILQRAGVFLDFENVLSDCYQRILGQGDTVVDIGAHAGRHTGQFCDIVGDDGLVMAFEPLSKQYSEIISRFGNQRCLRTFNCALSNFNGTAEFIVAQNAPEESGLRRKLFNNNHVETEKTVVKVRCLDDETKSISAVRFMKIDVEGAELLVLEGAQETIARCRPYIGIEYGYPGYSTYGNVSTSLFDFAKILDYACADLYGNIIETREEWQQVCDLSYWDYLLVPEERRSEYNGLYR